jgi:RNA polymerase sigma factor (sigma-70 family)
MPRTEPQTPGPALPGEDRQRWLEEQFTSHAAVVRAVVWNRLGRPRDPHQVEELAAETWARAVRAAHRGEVDPNRDFGSWVCGVAVNVCREHFRRQAREDAIPLPVPDELPDPQESTRAQELLDLHRALAECIERLPEDDRRVYRLRFEQGLSGRAAAEALDIPEATFREKRLPVLLRRLAHCLASKGFGDIPSMTGRPTARGHEKLPMIPDEEMARLLAEHAAARDCDLLREGLTPGERRRVTAAKARRGWQWARLGLAAAAVLLVGIGVWLWLSRAGRNGPPVGPSTHEGGAEVAFLDGRGRLVPVGEDTRFTVTDSEHGRVRLERGELYVELPAGAGLRAEVETSAGTATALGTRFYAHHHADSGEPEGHCVLAVVVLGGQVEVSNPHGRAVGDAGEVLLAEPDSAPEKHSEAAGLPPGHPRLGCPFAGALGLVYRADVQEELLLTDEQKARLQRPGRNELKEICQFFRGLHSLPRDERRRQTAQFCAGQQQRVGEILDAGQQQRLREIGLQVEGPFALVRGEVADQLRLVPGQREQVRAILEEFGEAYRPLASPDPANPDRDARITRLQQQTAAKLLALLSDSQKDQWRTFCGRPFPPAQRLIER